jgi:hypothetical protein
MWQAEDPAAFETAVRSTVALVLPSASVSCVTRTTLAVKLRIELGARRFIDVFFNARNQRADLTLIEDERRVLGYDNLGGWHRHPPEAPDMHQACDPPQLEGFLREVVRLLS